AKNCPLCKRTPLFFDAVVALGNYQDSMRQIILQMKRPQHESLTLAMGRLLAQVRYGELEGLCADVIVPIPMYWSRRLKRGTNNPELLARALGKKLGVPVDNRLLARVRNTQPQVNLTPRSTTY
ncbi:MAG: ComF family protein, partial [Thermoguttaceae bacterium]